MVLIEKTYAKVKTIGDFFNSFNGANPDKNLNDIISAVVYFIDIALATAGMVAVFILLFAAFDYATAYGDDSKAETAKKAIFWTISGLVVIGLAYAIVGRVDVWLLNNTKPKL
jgi:hypothetical protein